MADKQAAEAAPAERRMLFNKSGMAYILKPAAPEEERRVFKVGTAIMPIDAKEERDLLGYRGVVYADSIMPEGSGNSAELAKMKKKVAELTEENERLQNSLAAGVATKSKKG